MRVRHRHEEAVRRALAKREVEAFYPNRRVRKRWSDRTRTVTEPLFPGYVFCRIRRTQHRLCLELSGAVELVGFGGRAEPIDDAEMTSLRAAADSGATLTTADFLRPGRPVVVVDGPLAGASGILEEIRSRQRLLLRVSLLQRAVAAEVDKAFVRPAARNDR